MNSVEVKPKQSVGKILSEVRNLLRIVWQSENEKSTISLSELKEKISESISIDFKDLISFLEKHGYIILNRSNNYLYISKDGKVIAQGDKSSVLSDDLIQNFSERINVPVEGRKKSSMDLDGRYKKYVLIGNGGLGSVYKGEIINLKREIAIKQFKEIFAYFTEEQKLMILERIEEIITQHATLVHPNIVQIFDLNMKREDPYFVMEYVSGGNLKKIINSNNPIPINIVVSYFIQLLHAIRTAHELKIIHKNIKPENILIDHYGNLKLSDFSMNSIVERDSVLIKQVFIGMGSVAYLAPEYFQDPKKVDIKSDIYSLGILLYELCTKRIPGRRSPMPSEANKEIPKGLDEIFDKMTQDAPEDRYGSIQEILDDIYKHQDIVSFIDKRNAVLMPNSPLLDLGFSSADEPIEEDVANINHGLVDTQPVKDFSSSKVNSEAVNSSINPLLDQQFEDDFQMENEGINAYQPQKDLSLNNKESGVIPVNSNQNIEQVNDFTNLNDIVEPKAEELVDESPSLSMEAEEIISQDIEEVEEVEEATSMGNEKVITSSEDKSQEKKYPSFTKTPFPGSTSSTNLNRPLNIFRNKIDKNK